MPFTDNLIDIHAPNLPAIPASNWFNSQPITTLPIPDKVVLLDFWTYSCVNCLRTLPYLKKWQEKYADRGLVIIGVHTPEFAFEKEAANVEPFLKEQGINYPVVLDNDFLIWNAYANHYWPRKFLIDRSGVIRYDHIGEGAYQETEIAILRLLAEINPDIQVPKMAVSEMPAAGAVCYPTTAETYCGYARGLLGNAGGFQEDTVASYEAPSERRDGFIYLQGQWESKAEYLRHAAITNELSDYLELPWHGLECNLVMRSSTGKKIAVVVTLDDKPVPKAMAGPDIEYGEGQSFVYVEKARLYGLIKTKTYGEHRLRLATRSDKLECYAFTFGGCEEE